jgi:hypothetical protein
MRWGPACQVVDPIERPLGAQSPLQVTRYRPVPSPLATVETTHSRLLEGGGGHEWPTGLTVDVETPTHCCRGGGPTESGERGHLQMRAR